MTLHSRRQRRLRPGAWPWLPAAIAAAALLIAGCRPISDGGRGDQTAAEPRGEQPTEERTGESRPSEGQRGGDVAPAVTWDPAPSCENHPQDLAAWRAELDAADQDPAHAAYLAMLIDQMGRYTRLLPEYTVETLADALAADTAGDPEAEREQALTVLWLNLVSERLNRGTALTTEDFAAETATPAAASAAAPAGKIVPPQTVGDLIDRLAALPAGTPDLTWLISLADAVNRGDQPGAPVCAELIYRAGADLHTAQWTAGGVVTRTQTLSAPVGFTSFSPDHTRLVVQTPRGDSAGGPLYLYDLATKQTTNLNEHSGLPNYSSVSALKVVGWHPDNHHLLLANEDDEVTLWLDLDSASYTPVSLQIDSSAMAPPRAFTLAPDGSGFTFLTYDRDTQDTNLFWHDLAAGSTRLLLTIPADGGKLEGLQISPSGDQAVFVLRKGSRREGRSEELQLVSLTDGSSRLLLSGALGPVRPVWSPDGERIAFVRRNLDQPIKPGPHAVMPLGDIWTLAVESGEQQQLTYTAAIERPPVWSPAGGYLAFVTAGGEIGMVGSAPNSPSPIWRMGAELDQPQLTRIGFLP